MDADSKPASVPPSGDQVAQARETLLEHVQRALDSVMVLLSVAWIA